MDKTKTFSKQINIQRRKIFKGYCTKPGKNKLTEGRSERTFITGQLLANIIKKLKAVIPLMCWQDMKKIITSMNRLAASRDGFALTNFPYLNAGSLELRDNSGAATESSLRSFFGRVKYDFRNKYYLQGNLRYDKSSRFATEFRDALFPSVSAGWNISEETL